MNVPKIRFKGFDGEWSNETLNTFAKRITRKNANLETSLPVTISSADGIIPQTSFFNNVVASNNLRGYYLIKNGEFAYNKSYSNGYPFGAVKRLEKYDMGALSTLYILFNLSNDISHDYVVRFFETDLWHRDVAMRAAEGARNHGLLNISAENFLDIDIHFPVSYFEQQKISSLFQNLDSMIQGAEKKIASLRQMKEASLQAMFPAEGETAPKVRFKGFDGEWKIVKLGDQGKTTSGIGFPEIEQGGITGIPFFKVSDMNRDGNERCMNSSANYVSSEQINRLHWKVCYSVPAIFFAKVGAAVLLDRKRLVVSPCLCDNNTMLYCIDTSLWDASFCLYLFEHLRLSTLVQVGTLPSYNGNAIENMKERVPSLAEQQKIASYFTSLDKQISVQTKRLEKLRQIKSACLDAMFV